MVLATGLQVVGSKKPFLVIIRYNDQFRGDLHQYFPKYTLKSKTMTAKGIELVAEVKLGKQETHIIEDLQKVNGIISASLVRYSGDYN